MKGINLFVFYFLVFMPVHLLGQTINFNDEGVEITRNDGLVIFFDKFTGDALITTDTTGINTLFNQDSDWLVLPFFQGNLEQREKNWLLTFYTVNEKYFDIKDGYYTVPWLVDKNRLKLDAEAAKENLEDTLSQGIAFELSETDWIKISSAHDAKFRISGRVINLLPETLNQMNDITNKVADLETELGIESKTNKSSSPYELSWEGEIDRSPIIQTLPDNPNNSEVVITVRFEVRPDGTVGRIIPLRKMNPELEREVMSTLRSWRFSSLPGGVPQQTQWGTITFRFVVQ